MAADERTGDYMLSKMRIDVRCVCLHSGEVFLDVGNRHGGSDGLLRALTTLLYARLRLHVVAQQWAGTVSSLQHRDVWVLAGKGHVLEQVAELLAKASTVPLPN